MILLDTHALLWWALDPDHLSETAARAVREMERQGGYASSISIWELGIKVRRGLLELPIAVHELANRLERGGVVDLVPVDTTTWLRTVDLDWSHRDPADRVIVATALIKEVPVLTKDKAFHDFDGIDCVW